MTDISEISAEERAKRYRRLAQFALREARGADASTEEGYLLIAKEWENLAVQVENEMPLPHKH